MKSTIPIRDIKTLELIEEYLREKNERDYVLFLLGTQTGLKITDLINLRVENIEDWIFINIPSCEAGSIKKINISQKLSEVLKKFLSDKGATEYILKSRKGKNRPIMRQAAHSILQCAAIELGLSVIGCHTMRKTFGYHHYKEKNNIDFLQERFNHSNPTVTLRYIGITEEDIDENIYNVPSIKV